uniref:PH domain-containing protein n=1 Tax=Trichuris muris TaxID=70415 RepID=A0A5S6QNB4_TRIMR
METTVQYEEPLCRGDLLVKMSAFLSHKWRRRYMAVFTKGRFGVARIELFRNVDDYTRGNTERIILLSGCAAVQLVHDEKERRSTLKVHLSNASFSFQSAHFDDLQRWQRFICEAAFGDNTDVQRPKLPIAGDQPPAVQTRIVAAQVPGKSAVLYHSY